MHSAAVRMLPNGALPRMFDTVQLSCNAVPWLLHAEKEMVGDKREGRNRVGIVSLDLAQGTALIHSNIQREQWRHVRSTYCSQLAAIHAVPGRLFDTWYQARAPGIIRMLCEEAAEGYAPFFFFFLFISEVCAE